MLSAWGKNTFLEAEVRVGSCGRWGEGVNSSDDNDDGSADDDGGDVDDDIYPHGKKIPFFGRR